MSPETLRREAERREADRRLAVQYWEAAKVLEDHGGLRPIVLHLRAEARRWGR